MAHPFSALTIPWFDFWFCLGFTHTILDWDRMPSELYKYLAYLVEALKGAMTRHVCLISRRVVDLHNAYLICSAFWYTSTDCRCKYIGLFMFSWTLGSRIQRGFLLVSIYDSFWKSHFYPISLGCGICDGWRFGVRRAIQRICWCPSIRHHHTFWILHNMDPLCMPHP